VRSFFRSLPRALGALGCALTGTLAAAEPPAPGLTLHLVTPCAIFDTRAGQGGLGRPLAGGETVYFDTILPGYAGQGGTAGGCGIPRANLPGEGGNTAAVLLNLVALNATAWGNLRAWDPDTGAPEGGVMIYNAGLNNNIIVPLNVKDRVAANDDGGHLAIQNNGTQPVDVRGVVVGYYTGSGNSAAPEIAALESLRGDWLFATETSRARYTLLGPVQPDTEVGYRIAGIDMNGNDIRGYYSVKDRFYAVVAAVSQNAYHLYRFQFSSKDVIAGQYCYDEGRGIDESKCKQMGGIRTTTASYADAPAASADIRAAHPSTPPQ